MKIFSFFLLIYTHACFGHTLNENQVNTILINDDSVISWNHIKNKQGVYAGLQKSADEYQLKKTSSTPKASTNYQITLVKKLVNWQEQHSNGIEVLLDDLSLTFAQLNELHFKLKLFPKNSILLKNIATVNQANAWLKDSQAYTNIASKKAHITLLFYGKKHNDPQESTIYGAYPMQLNVNSEAHSEVFNITTTDLTYYWQKNYQETAATFKDVSNMTLKGFIIVAESGNNKVVRNYLSDSFPTKYTEIFNEFDITLSDLNITRSF